MCSDYVVLYSSTVVVDSVHCVTGREMMIGYYILMMRSVMS